jgi:hypothetical protein
VWRLLPPELKLLRLARLSKPKRGDFSKGSSLFFYLENPR